MDPEIEKYLKIALDSGVSSYYRKDAIRHLGRLRKSAELTNAILKLLKDVDDQSLQKEAMDLAVQFTISEAVNILLPISIGKGMNARNAINALAKIGGVHAYKSLKEVASAPGFDLSKTAAKRALEDMLRREPNLENESEESPSIVDGAKEIFNDIKDSIIGEEEKKPEEPEVKPAVELSEEPEVKPAIELIDAVKLNRELKSLQSKYKSLEHKLAEKTAKVEELEDKIRTIKKGDEASSEIKKLKKQVHDGRNESASVKASFEKQVALLKGKLISLEEENEDLIRRTKSKILKHQNANKGGCFSLILVLGIFLFIVWFMFSA